MATPLSTKKFERIDFPLAWWVTRVMKTPKSMNLSCGPCQNFFWLPRPQKWVKKFWQVPQLNWHVSSPIWAFFCPQWPILPVKNRFSQIFPAPEGSPFLTVNLTVKQARLVFLALCICVFAYLCICVFYIWYTGMSYLISLDLMLFKYIIALKL